MMKRISLSAICVAMALGVTALCGGVSRAAVRINLGAFAKTETVVRENLVKGTEHPVDKRTVTLRVNETRDLRGRQEIVVSWSGAHPTGGIVADENSIDAQQEEYPVVLLERAISRQLSDGLPAIPAGPVRAGGRPSTGSRCSLAAAGGVQIPTSAHPALGAVHGRRRSRLLRGPGGLRRPAT